MRKSVKRGIVAGVALGLIGGSVAWGSWLSDGRGNAVAQAGTAKPVTTSIENVTVDSLLYPTLTADAKIKISNPNPYNVEVQKIKWTPSDGVTASRVAAGKTCGNTGVYFGDFTNGPIGTDGLRLDKLVIGAGQTREFTLPNAVHMINNSEDGCQGATFSVPVTVTVASTDKAPADLRK
jgi:hypothetical protein